MLIPSDHSLYGMAGELRNASLYELNPQDGNILRLLQVDDEETGRIVACVHDGKFLSFDHGGGKLVPLIGTAEPFPLKGASSESPERDGKGHSSEAERY
jgi:hypothetical protein